MEKKKFKIFMLIGLVVLAISIGLFYFYIKGDTTSTSDTSSNGFPFVVFTPIIFSLIPTFAGNKEKDLDPKQKKLLIFFMSAGILMVIVSILYIILG